MAVLARTQPDYLWGDPYKHFIAWYREQCITNLGLPSGSRSPSAAFVPQDCLEAYLQDHALELLQAVFGDSARNPLARAVIKKAPRAFAILLLLGEADHIKSFLQHGNLSDTCLPFLEEPVNFPRAPRDRGFFAAFEEAQWEFCAYKFEKDAELDAHVPAKTILPIIRMTELAQGDTATVYTASIHPSYDGRFGEDGTESSSLPVPKTYALKLYNGRYSERCYNTEVSGFRHVADHQLGQNIIGCYWGFRHGLSHGLLLELADGGTLDEFWECTSPPTGPNQIRQLWYQFSRIIEGLLDIHGGPDTHTSDLPVARGWHQDVKPANILVVAKESNQAACDCKFRLSDLGLSHFQRTNNLVASDRDAGGTRDYGAPEASHHPNASRGAYRSVGQSVDVWSFGCICLEFGCWLVSGAPGLSNFREERRLETEQYQHHHTDRYCFHDGRTLLECAQRMLATVKWSVSEQDNYTPRVMDLVSRMLVGFSVRLTSMEVAAGFRDILRDNPLILRTSRPRISGASDGHPSSSTFPRRNPRGSPVAGHRPLSDTTVNSTISSKDIGIAPPSSEHSRLDSGVAGLEISQEGTEHPRARSTSRTRSHLGNWPQADAWKWFRDRKDYGTLKDMPGKHYFDEMERRDVIFLLDDVQSMAPHLVEAQQTIRLLGWLLKKIDKDGVDLYTTGSPDSSNFKNTTSLEQKIRTFKHQLKANSDISIRLRQILDPYREDMIKKPRNSTGSRRFALPLFSSREAKPLLLYVLTDGRWRDESSAFDPINTVIQAMRDNDYPQRHIGIQFIQFGSSSSGKKKLEELDDMKAWEDKDIVDTEPYGGNFLKIALGAIEKAFDHQDGHG